jgi:hypothetical protein
MVDTCFLSEYDGRGLAFWLFKDGRASKGCMRSFDKNRLPEPYIYTVYLRFWPTLDKKLAMSLY